MHPKQKTESKTTVFIYNSPRGPFTFAASPQLRMPHIAFYPYRDRFRNRLYFELLLFYFIFDL